MEKKTLTISVLFFALIGMGALALFISLNKELVYEVHFTNTEKNEKVEVNGLVKRYSLEETKDGKLMEIENYVMEKDEVELKVKVPENFKDYKNLVVEAEFENPDNPTLEVGVRKQVDYNLGEPVYDWEWEYLDNKYLNEYKKYLGEEWTAITDEAKGLTLFQKEKIYNSVEGFLENPPEAKEVEEKEIDENGIEKIVKKEVPQIATVNYDLEQKYSFPENTFKKSNFPYSFRGSFDMYVYYNRSLSNNLSLSLLKQDLNRYEGIDEYEIKIYDEQNKLLFYKILEDEGITDVSKRINIQHFLEEISIPKSELLHISFNSLERTNDSMIRNITINMPYTLINNFNIVDQEGFAANITTKPVTLYTLWGELSVNPAYIDGEQDIKINDNNNFIKYKGNNIFSLPELRNTIFIPMNNVVVQHKENPIAFKNEQFFNISPQKTIPFSSSLSKKIEFVIAQYIPQKTIKKTEQSFSIENIYINEKNQAVLKLKSAGSESYNNTIVLKNLSLKIE